MGVDYTVERIYNEVIGKVTSSQDTWKELLRLNGRLYRYEELKEDYLNTNQEILNINKEMEKILNAIQNFQDQILLSAFENSLMAENPRRAFRYYCVLKLCIDELQSKCEADYGEAAKRLECFGAIFL